MSVITFINGMEEKTGKTMALAAIATNIAIENNNRILVISTTNKEDKMKTCFFEEQQLKKFRMGILGESKNNTIESESGIEGIAKLARSNKLTPQLITSYSRVVLKDRLEIILGTIYKEENAEDNEEKKEIAEEYLDLIRIASMHYDKIFVDLDNNLREDIRKKIIDMSDLVIVSVNQNYSALKKLKEMKQENELFKNPNTFILIGRYDKFSKYNAKNITRFLEEKNQVLTMPYNTLFFEAAEEAGVPDLLLNLKKVTDPEDRNKIFIEEVKRASEKIVYTLKELQMRR